MKHIYEKIYRSVFASLSILVLTYSPLLFVQDAAFHVLLIFYVPDLSATLSHIINFSKCDGSSFYIFLVPIEFK